MAVVGQLNYKTNRKIKEGFKMVTWIVEEKDVDKRYSLNELKEFSKKPHTKVIIRGILALEGGVVSYLQ